MIGLDLLGLPRFARVAREGFPDGAALGVFARTFGDAFPSVEKVLLTGKVAALRVHLLWKDDHKFGAAEIAQAMREAPRWEALARRFPGVAFYISPFCEHRLRSPDGALERVARLVPSCQVVNSYIPGGQPSRKYLNEVHGLQPAPRFGAYIYSFDGLDPRSVDAAAICKQHKRAIARFYWIPAYNGRRSVSDRTPRPQRRAWPTKRTFARSVIDARRQCGSPLIHLAALTPDSAILSRREVFRALLACI